MLDCLQLFFSGKSTYVSGPGEPPGGPGLPPGGPGRSPGLPPGRPGLTGGPGRPTGGWVHIVRPSQSVGGSTCTDIATNVANRHTYI